MSDLYADLGLTPDASTEEIVRAGRDAAKEHHPDKGGNAEAFTRVMTALTVLRDPQKRAKYDQTGETEQVDPVRLEEAQALSILNQKLMMVITQADPEITDVVQHLRQLVQADIDQATANREETKNQLKKFQGFAKRLRRKDGKPNQLGMFIETHISGAKERIVAIEAAMRGLRRAHGMAAEYVYDFDAPKPRMEEWVQISTGGGSSNSFFKSFNQT